MSTHNIYIHREMRKINKPSYLELWVLFICYIYRFFTGFPTKQNLNLGLSPHLYQTSNSFLAITEATKCNYAFLIGLQNMIIT